MTSPRNSAPRVDTSAINHAPISALSGESIVLDGSGCIVSLGVFASACRRRHNRGNHQRYSANTNEYIRKVKSGPMPSYEMEVQEIRDRALPYSINNVPKSAACHEGNRHCLEQPVRTCSPNGKNHRYRNGHSDQRPLLVTEKITENTKTDSCIEAQAKIEKWRDFDLVRWRR